jgi:predicted transglutaminase-like cysteine proteinase
MKSRLFRRAGKFLCAAFAVAAMSASPAAAAGTQGPGYPYSAPPLPQALGAFGAGSVLMPLAENPFAAKWDGMLARQAEAAQAPYYRRFRREFNELRGEPLKKLARDLNDAVLDRVFYMYDQMNYGQSDYWASPAETAWRGSGDCEDYAILQYGLLRHLGVPESRLFVALVNSHNENLPYLDHAVLLLDVARAGETPRFMVLNNGGPVDGDARYQRGNVPGWSDPYVFLGAMNAQGYWETAALGVQADQWTGRKHRQKLPVVG